ncbi:MAG: hypothetical protein ABL900_07210 [Burkholderiaceae bacterium]
MNHMQDPVATDYADIATAPFEGPGFTGNQRYTRKWQFPVRHEHFNGTRQMRVDTVLTLWEAKGGSDTATLPHVMEKRLIDLPDVLATLAVAEERANIRRLTAMKMPCARLVQGVAGFDNDDPLAIYTEYVGPSLDEVFRHALTDDEFANVCAAYFEGLAAYAEKGVFLIDISPRNACVALSHGLRGRIEFPRIKFIDHRHTRFAGNASQHPWPDLGLKEGSLPEGDRLLAADVAADLSDLVPGCPVSRWADLRHLPQQERSHWAARLKSPALGGALDSGALNIDAASQSLAAFGLKELLLPTLSRSRQPHPTARRFLESRIAILDRMNASSPEQRFPSLRAAAHAWLSGGGSMITSTTEIELRTPNAPIDGASQPHPADRSGARDSVGADQAASARRSSGAQHATHAPDGLKPTAVWAHLWRGGRSQTTAGAILALLALAWILLASTARHPTPGLLMESRQLEHLARLERELSTARQGDHVRTTVSNIIQIQQTTQSSAVRRQAEHVLEVRWGALMRKLSVPLIDAQRMQGSQQARALSMVHAWAHAGFSKAAQWKHVPT